MDYKRAIEILNEYGFTTVDRGKYYIPICWNNVIVLWIEKVFNLHELILKIRDVSAFKKANPNNLNNFDPSLIGSFRIDKTEEKYLREQCEKNLAKAKKWYEQDQINMARKDFL